jgi:hypothetical protein
VTCKVALGVNDAERRNVDEIVFEIFQVERFQILFFFFFRSLNFIKEKKVAIQIMAVVLIFKIKVVG